MNLMDEYAIVESGTGGRITIPTEEYKELLKTQARAEVFEKYVKSQEFSISRTECAWFLGFELGDSKEESCEDI